MPVGARSVDAADLPPEAAVPAWWRQLLACDSPVHAPLLSDWAVVRSQLPLSVNIDHVLAVFHNGAGDYLCLHFPDTGDATASGMIWWHEHPDTLEPVEFWGVLDAWIGIFVEEADPVTSVS